MFSKQDRNKRPPGTDTIIGQASQFQGQLHCETDLHIEGTMQGDIVCSRNVIIRETGIVESNIKAANLIIAGRLNGNMEVSGSCVIEVTGKLTGDVTSATLVIREGGIFNGRSMMSSAETPSNKSERIAVAQAAATSSVE